ALGIGSAFRTPQHVPRDGGEPLITEEPLMCGGIVGLDEGLMALLQICWGVGQGELTVVQPPLDIEVGFDQVLIALTLTSRHSAAHCAAARKEGVSWTSVGGV